MKRTLSFSFVVIIVLGLALVPVKSLESTDHETDLENAATFIQNQYNIDLQLLAESPNEASNVYWLWNDNFLAYESLKYYNTTMADAIYAKLEQYGYMKNYVYETLFGKTIELPFNHYNHYNVTKGAGYTIKLDIYNGSLMGDWHRYANLLLLAVLSEYWDCNTIQAIEYFNKAANMWDGTGIVDEVNNDPEGKNYGTYETYKLALLLYTERILGQTLDFHNEAEVKIWEQQNDTNYGIHTHYYANNTPTGSDVNVETTSLVIGTYKWQFSCSCPDSSPTTTQRTTSFFDPLTVLTSMIMVVAVHNIIYRVSTSKMD